MGRKRQEVNQRRQKGSENISNLRTRAISELNPESSKDKHNHNSCKRDVKKDRIPRAPSLADIETLPSLVHFPRDVRNRRGRLDDVSEISAITLNSNVYRLPP